MWSRAIVVVVILLIHRIYGCRVEWIEWTNFKQQR